MKKTTICRYEKDEHDITSSVIVELAKALHTTPNNLLMG
ncbi:MAG: helix-turn-helix transcriptional regulator [Anaerovibrio sp.]|nr:helix-turn-helix transcriptional regulator [Anaerovibrio sp.]MBE6099786.1 helix-turn-helix transcriptional regulator [Anaerovibrio sp.]